MSKYFVVESQTILTAVGDSEDRITGLQSVVGRTRRGERRGKGREEGEVELTLSNDHSASELFREHVDCKRSR